MWVSMHKFPGRFETACGCCGCVGTGYAWHWSEYGAGVAAEEREFIESKWTRDDAALLLQADL